MIEIRTEEDCCQVSELHCGRSARGCSCDRYLSDRAAIVPSPFNVSTAADTPCIRYLVAYVLSENAHLHRLAYVSSRAHRCVCLLPFEALAHNLQPRARRDICIQTREAWGIAYVLTTDPVQRAVCCVVKELPTIFIGFPHSKSFSPNLHLGCNISITTTADHPGIHNV